MSGAKDAIARAASAGHQGIHVGDDIAWETLASEEFLDALEAFVTVTGAKAVFARPRASSKAISS